MATGSKRLSTLIDVSVSLAEHEMTYEWDGEEYDYQEIRLTISMKRKGGIIIIAPPGLLVVVSWVGFPILQSNFGLKKFVSNLLRANFR